MDFFTVFNPPPKYGFVSEEPSLTQQSFKDDCDINVILERFAEGPRPDSPASLRAPRVPMFGDFSHLPDVREFHYQVEQARASFEALPAALRLRFGNNPIEMMAFVQSASPEQMRDVFGSKSVPSPSAPVEKVAGVSAVNSETVAEQKA